MKKLIIIENLNQLMIEDLIGRVPCIQNEAGTLVVPFECENDIPDRYNYKVIEY